MTGGARLLVVEDEPVIAMLLEDSLRNLGHVVLGPFRQPEPALAAIDTESPDAALLDLNLGRGKTSYPIAERLLGLGIPFMFLTGYGETAIDPQFAATPLIVKPFAHEQLAAAVAVLLGTAG